MDCVRVSTNELRNERYIGSYVFNVPLEGQGADACRQGCVSPNVCKAWYYTPDGKCMVTEWMHDGHSESAPTGTAAGMIRCANDWSMLKLIWWIVILGSILFGVWWMMNRCPSQRKR